MAQIPVRNLDGDEVGTTEVSDDVFAAPINEALVHQSVVQLLANQRAGTHKTKTRGEVSGGGQKPWRQKGTGRARQGSRVSPLWRGGGTVFGPQPRGYTQSMPKKMRRAAMKSGLSSRLREGAIVALDAFTVDEPKTRTVAAALDALELAGRVLIVDTEFEHNAFLAARNLRNVEMQTAHSLNLLEVLAADTLVFTVPALQAVAERLTNGTR